MNAFEAAKRAAHRQNLGRYHRLLATPLTPDERQFIERRVAEEQAELEKMTAPRRAESLRDMLGFGTGALAPADATSGL